MIEKQMTIADEVLYASLKSQLRIEEKVEEQLRETSSEGSDAALTICCARMDAIESQIKELEEKYK